MRVLISHVTLENQRQVDESGSRNSDANCVGQYGGKKDRRKLVGETVTSGANNPTKPAFCVPTVRVQGRRYKNKPEFRVSQYTISNSKNKFTVIGCDTSAYLSGYQNGELYKIGCSSECPTFKNVVNGSCSGVGCCELGFPDGLKNISTVEVNSFNNHSNVWDFNPCGYEGQFNFTADHLKNYTNQTVPLVLDWAVSNLTCEEARNKPNFACKDINNECIDLQTRQDGYRCQCKQGCKGNPYLQGQGGCQDIDECEDPTLNNCTKLCTNEIGNYTCGCPRWYRGDGRKDGEGCSVHVVLAIKVSIGIGIGLIAMLGVARGSSWAKIFTFEELKVATKNYKESRIIGRGGFGTVYKGFLPNNTIVAIKKSKTVDLDQVDQFINEIVLLSQIEHKNVVKLLGCCLETQVPLLVYEFVSQEIKSKSRKSLKVKGDERPSMKGLAMELERIRKIESTQLWVNAQSNMEKAEHLDGAYENGGSSTTAGFDSMKDNPQQNAQ
ncbi:hypothetical protein FH972_018100 [Carpinus fangiana]|uniref:Protein kinase domain-containing protein n=1 Tax=Carpinus fangiana TaxID=176857 RepID=A0A5N6RN34_9ROSI|nr:hypothetical protein FH972_018100 [Carpinus fangiana]